MSTPDRRDIDVDEHILVAALAVAAAVLLIFAIVIWRDARNPAATTQPVAIVATLDHATGPVQLQTRGDDKGDGRLDPGEPRLTGLVLGGGVLKGETVRPPSGTRAALRLATWDWVTQAARRCPRHARPVRESARRPS
jgi:hypothetical protein